MEYYQERKYKIVAGLALRIGEIVQQYEKLKLPEEDSHDVTLNLCLLHVLLTQCDELIDKMNKNTGDDFGLHRPIQEIDWGLQDLMPDMDDFDGCVSMAKLVKHLRNAMCHPTEFNPDARIPSTGYTTLSDKSKNIKEVVFCDSPDVKMRSKSQLEHPRIFQITITPIQLKTLVLNLANLLAQPTIKNWNGKTITKIIPA